MATETKGKAAGERSGRRNPAPRTKGSEPAAAKEQATGPTQDAQPGAGSDIRHRRISEAAYYRAERRGFAAGYENTDWLEAENETAQRQHSISGNQENSMDFDDLNKCLKSELSAIETYHQALEKHRNQHAHDAKFQQLAQMLEDHRDAASQLRTFIQQNGGRPSDDSGAWGTWSKTVMGAAKLLGDKAALKALKEGEESGLKEYQSAARDSAASADMKTITSPLMARQQEHIRQLDRLIETA